jgi:hypothetical protein
VSNPVVRLARQQILRLLDGQRIQVPTSVGLLDIEAKTDDRWQPLRRIPVPEHIVAFHRANGLTPPVELWRNDIYEVFVNEAEPDDHQNVGGKHLSIKRYDRAPVRNWRHLQQIKNEVAGEFIEALELFPSEGRIADNANQYHLFCLPEGMDIPVGFPSGMVVIEPEDVEFYNAQGRGRQEPMQEGLTVGAQMQAAQERDGIKPAHALKGMKGLKS